MPYLSALEVRSRRGAIQIHLYLYYLLFIRRKSIYQRHFCSMGYIRLLTYLLTFTFTFTGERKAFEKICRIVNNSVINFHSFIHSFIYSFTYLNQATRPIRQTIVKWLYNCPTVLKFGGPMRLAYRTASSCNASQLTLF